VLQTIFLRLLRHVPRRDSAGTFPGNEESYLRRAAVNASLDVIRARQTAQTVPLGEAVAPTNDSPTELRDCLRRALAGLSPRSAEIFALRYLEDFTNQQIARALNMSQVHVAVALHRTRRQLQKEMNRSYFGGRL
jgi:RNA polymerase sigma factor (sigma-70 family)